MTDHVLGVDLGGTNVRVAIGPVVGDGLAELAAATARGDSSAVVAQVATLSLELADSVPVDRSSIAGIAVGVPGVVPADGGAIGLSPNLPALGRLDVAGALFERLRVPVSVENDVNLATLAEHRHGLAVGIADFVFVSVGTGVGMGLVAGGTLQRGATGAAGEIGFLPLTGDPYDRANQVHGPLEEAAGGVGIARRYAELAGTPTDPSGAIEVYARAAAGDPRAGAVLDDQARATALAVVSVHSVLDPELIVFGGGIGSRADFVARVRAHVARLTLREPRIEISVLGRRAGLIGATVLARDKALETASAAATRPAR